MPAGISAPAPMPPFSSPLPGPSPFDPALANSSMPLHGVGALPPSALTPGAHAGSGHLGSSGTPPPTQVAAEYVAGATDGAAAGGGQPVAAASSS